MPVLKERDVISRMAVPVVSEPVPAVVGIAIRGSKVLVIGNPFPTGALIKSIKSAALYTENLKERISTNNSRQKRKMDEQISRFGCVNYASPTDSAYNEVRRSGLQRRNGVIRQEMTEIVFAGPGNSIAPTLFRRLCDHSIIYFKREIRFFLKSHNCLGRRNKVMVDCNYISIRLTVLAGLSFATLGSVNSPTWPELFREIFGCPLGLTLRAFMFLRSIPTSSVTPSPKRRLAAAT